MVKCVLNGLNLFHCVFFFQSSDVNLVNFPALFPSSKITSLLFPRVSVFLEFGSVLELVLGWGLVLKIEIGLFASKPKISDFMQFGRWKVLRTSNFKWPEQEKSLYSTHHSNNFEPFKQVRTETKMGRGQIKEPPPPPPPPMQKFRIPFYGWIGYKDILSENVSVLHLNDNAIFVRDVKDVHIMYMFRLEPYLVFICDIIKNHICSEDFGGPHPTAYWLSSTDSLQSKLTIWLGGLSSWGLLLCAGLHSNIGIVEKLSRNTVSNVRRSCLAKTLKNALLWDIFSISIYSKHQFHKTGAYKGFSCW